MCYYIIQNFVPRLHLQRFGRWSLGNPGTFCGYLPHRRHVMPSRLPPRDCVSNARLSVAPCDRPGRAGRLCGVPLPGPRRGIDLEVYVAQDATSRYRTRSSRGFILCSFYIAMRSHARAALPDCASLRSFAEQRYLACCVAP